MRVCENSRKNFQKNYLQCRERGYYISHVIDLIQVAVISWLASYNTQLYVSITFLMISSSSQQENVLHEVATVGPCFTLKFLPVAPKTLLITEITATFRHCQNLSMSLFNFLHYFIFSCFLFHNRVQWVY